MTGVVVVGGGLAGITAALHCADAGRPVTLLEARPRLGGLTSSFRRGELAVDNGQHVFLRCCTAYRALLDRLGVTGSTQLQPRLDIPVLTPTGRARLRRSGLPAPLHLGTALLGYRPLTPAQRLRAVRAALALRGLDRSNPACDSRTFGEWLHEHGQDDATIAALWDLVTVATLNAPAERASLALAAMVFQVGFFGTADAADIGWSRVPLGQLHGQAALDQLTRAGVRVCTGTRATGLRADGGGWLVGADGPGSPASSGFSADAVVLAVPPGPAQALLPGPAPAWATGLGTSPIVNVHLVLDRRVLDEPFAAGVGTPVQWVFDRTGQSGLAGPGQYLALSLSAADELVDRPVAYLRELLLPPLATLLPGLAGARLLDFFVTREREATFRPAPGTAALRPGPHTVHPGLFLAGAWTDTGWPATMEGAVRSGGAAARAAVSMRAEAVA